MFSAPAAEMGECGGHCVRAVLVLCMAAMLFTAPLGAQTPPMEVVTLEQAVERAIKNNPTVAQASQGILRAEGLLQQARSATLPFVTANVSSPNVTARR